MTEAMRRQVVRFFCAGISVDVLATMYARERLEIENAIRQTPTRAERR